MEYMMNMQPVARGSFVALRAIAVVLCLSASNALAELVTYELAGNETNITDFASPEGPGVAELETDGTGTAVYDYSYNLSGTIELELSDDLKTAMFPSVNISPFHHDDTPTVERLVITSTNNTAATPQFERVATKDKVDKYHDIRFEDTFINPHTLQFTLDGTDMKISSSDLRAIDGDGYSTTGRAVAIPEPRAAWLLLGAASIVLLVAAGKFTLARAA